MRESERVYSADSEVIIDNIGKIEFSAAKESGRRHRRVKLCVCVFVLKINVVYSHKAEDSILMHTQ